MTEQAEWELIDEPAVRPKRTQGRDDDRGSTHRHAAGNGASGFRHAGRLPKGPLLQAILGKGWRWKTALIGASGAVILAFMATVAAVAVVAAAAGATVLLAVGKLRRMLARTGTLRPSPMMRHPGK